MKTKDQILLERCSASSVQSEEVFIDNAWAIFLRKYFPIPIEWCLFSLYFVLHHSGDSFLYLRDILRSWRRGSDPMEPEQKDRTTGVEVPSETAETSGDSEVPPPAEIKGKGMGDQLPVPNEDEELSTQSPHIETEASESQSDVPYSQEAAGSAGRLLEESFVSDKAKDLDKSDPSPDQSSSVSEQETADKGQKDVPETVSKQKPLVSAIK